MTTVKEILTENRKDMIDLLKDLFPTLNTVTQMVLFFNYCVENGLSETSNVYDFMTNFYKQQIANGVNPMPKPKQDSNQSINESRISFAKRFI